MGDVDRLFYDIDKTIDLTLLQKLSEDYNTIMNENDREIEKTLELPSLDDIMDNDQNGTNNMQFDPNMIDFENIDLLSIPETSLRRAPI